MRAVVESLGVAGANVEYLPDFLSPSEADHYYRRLMEEVQFNSPDESRVRRPFSSELVRIRRLQTAYGDPGTSYTFSGCTVVGRPWIPVIAELRELLRTRAGAQCNHVLINHYRDGTDRIGWHRDSERDLGPEPTIHSLSLGAVRDFQLRHRVVGQARRVEPKPPTFTLPLEPGSLLVMRHPTNAEWVHKLPERRRVAGGRLNLTWRSVAVCRN